MWLDVVSMRAIAIFIGASDGSRLTLSAAGTVDVSSGKSWHRGVHTGPGWHAVYADAPGCKQWGEHEFGFRAA
jgi:hypothetical protein